MTNRPWLIWLLLTPLFAVLDFALGLNVRTVALDEPVWRLAYYLALTALAFIVWRWPGWDAPLALLEAAVNVGLLLVHAWLLILGATASFEQGSPLPDGRWWVNLVLVGAVGIAAFHAALWRLRDPASR